MLCKVEGGKFELYNKFKGDKSKIIELWIDNKRLGSYVNDATYISQYQKVEWEKLTSLRKITIDGGKFIGLDITEKLPNLEKLEFNNSVIHADALKNLLDSAPNIMGVKKNQSPYSSQIPIESIPSNAAQQNAFTLADFLKNPINEQETRLDKKISEINRNGLINRVGNYVRKNINIDTVTDTEDGNLYISDIEDGGLIFSESEQENDGFSQGTDLEVGFVSSDDSELEQDPGDLTDVAVGFVSSDDSELEQDPGALTDEAVGFVSSDDSELEQDAGASTVNNYPFRGSTFSSSNQKGSITARKSTSFKNQNASSLSADERERPSRNRVIKTKKNTTLKIGLGSNSDNNKPKSGNNRSIRPKTSSPQSQGVNSSDLIFNNRNNGALRTRFSDRNGLNAPKGDTLSSSNKRRLMTKGKSKDLYSSSSDEQEASRFNARKSGIKKNTNSFSLFSSINSNSVKDQTPFSKSSQVRALNMQSQFQSTNPAFDIEAIGRVKRRSVDNIYRHILNTLQSLPSNQANELFELKKDKGSKKVTLMHQHTPVLEARSESVKVFKSLSRSVTQLTLEQKALVVLGSLGIPPCPPEGIHIQIKGRTSMLADEIERQFELLLKAENDVTSESENDEAAFTVLVNSGNRQNGR